MRAHVRLDNGLDDLVPVLDHEIRARLARQIVRVGEGIVVAIPGQVDVVVGVEEEFHPAGQLGLAQLPGDVALLNDDRGHLAKPVVGHVEVASDQLALVALLVEEGLPAVDDLLVHRRREQLLHRPRGALCPFADPPLQRIELCLVDVGPSHGHRPREKLLVGVILVGPGTGRRGRA